MQQGTCEIITIGREILDGRVTDTNATFLGEHLSQAGLVPRFAQRVDDHIERILSVFSIAQARSHWIFVTGGLGPTSDDLTAEAFAQFLNKPLILHTEALAQIQSFLQKIQRPFSDLQKKQAYLPQDCIALCNQVGTAPGFAWISPHKNGGGWFFMPGVPVEMKQMFVAQVLPWIEKMRPKRNRFFQRTWLTHFVPEVDLQQRLNPLLEDKVFLQSQAELTFRTVFPENHVGLVGEIDSKEKESAFLNLSRQISEALGADAYALVDNVSSPTSLEACVLELAIRKNIQFGFVESCTGGLLSQRVTAVAGASRAFWGSWVTYSNEAKHQLVGVSPELIEAHGAVSAPVAEAMALGGLQILQKSNQNRQNTICISITGIAGPAGGSELKPVGLCYIGIAYSASQRQISEKFQARPSLTREQVQKIFSQKALQFLFETLRSHF